MAQKRPSLRSSLDCPAELGKRNHGHFQLSCKWFEGPGNLRDLLLPAINPPAALDELKIVYDHKAESVLHLEPAW